MEFAKVIYNGKLVDFSCLIDRGEALLSELYLYQNIHVRDDKPYFLDQHLAILSRNANLVFGSASLVKTDEIFANIKELLLANSCLNGSYCVRIYLWRNSLMLMINQRLLYPKFTLWHSRMNLKLIKCENPLTGISSSVSLSLAGYAEGLAKGSVGLCENLDGVVTGVGDMPVFFVKQSVIYTSPVSCGVSVTVEREQLIKTIKRRGYKLIEKDISSANLSDYDEIFYVNTQGLVAFNGIGDKIFFTLVAQILADNYGL